MLYSHCRAAVIKYHKLDRLNQQKLTDLEARALSQCVSRPWSLQRSSWTVLSAPSASGHLGAPWPAAVSLQSLPPPSCVWPSPWQFVSASRSLSSDQDTSPVGLESCPTPI